MGQSSRCARLVRSPRHALLTTHGINEDPDDCRPGGGFSVVWRLVEPSLQGCPCDLRPICNNGIHCLALGNGQRVQLIHGADGENSRQIIADPISGFCQKAVRCELGAQFAESGDDHLVGAPEQRREQFLKIAIPQRKRFATRALHAHPLIAAPPH